MPVSPEEILLAAEAVPGTTDSEGRLPGPSKEPWKLVAAKLEDQLKPNYVYQIFHENRYNLHHLLCQKRSINWTNLKKGQPEREEEEEDEDQDEVQKRVPLLPEAEFVIKLTSADFKKMAPVKREYARKDRPSKRCKWILPPNSYADIIVRAAWEQHRLACPYSFDRATVYSEGSDEYIRFEAHCPECTAKAVGRILTAPKTDEDVVIYWRAPDMRNTVHSKSRPLRGDRRVEVARGIAFSSATAFYDREADALMSQGDVKAPTLYTKQVLRKAKQQQRDKDLGIPLGSHGALNLSNMKHTVPHAGNIHDIGLDRFFVHYHSRAQILLYQDYCKRNYGVLVVDATGKLVRKLSRPDGDSSHIFLYLGVVEYLGSTLPVVQMLSEKQDTCAVVSWILEWQKDGAPIPKEVWIDNSPALKSAFARTLCNCKDIHEYKEMCWNALVNEGPLPSCYLRLDVAHYIGRAAKWSVWRDKMAARLKDTYLRCLGLLVKSSTLQEVKDLLLAVLLLAGSPYDSEDANEEMPVQTVQTALSFITKKIKGCGEDFAEEVADKVDEPFYAAEEEDEDEELRPGKIKDFLKSLQEKVDEDCPPDGDLNPNPYYLPTVAEKFVKLASDFPLWTGVMVPLFKSPHETASSARVEAAFKYIKSHTLEGQRVLWRADKFVAQHLKSISGICKTVGANALRNSRQQSPSSGANSTDENSVDSPSDHGTRKSETKKQNGLSTSSSGKTNKKNKKVEEVILTTDSEEEEETPYDLNNFENWRNLGKKPKQNNTSKYLNPFPEVQALRDADMLKPPANPLLRNGNKVGFVATQNNTKVKINNTCAFDAVAQIFANGYLNFTNCRQNMSESRNSFLKAATSLAINGACRETYELRCEALTPIVPLTTAHAKSGKQTRVETRRSVLGVEYECMSHPQDLTTSLLKGIPSITIEGVTCRCSKELEILPVLSLVTVEFKHLQDAVLSSIISHEVICECSPPKETTVKYGQHLVLDVDVFSSIQSSETSVRIKKSIQIKITDIPVTLQLDDGKFVLSGVAGKPPHRFDHVVAYTRDCAGNWKLCDDLQKKRISIDITNIETSPSLLVYMKI